MRTFARIGFVFYALIASACALISAMPQGATYGLPWVIGSGIAGFPWSIIAMFAVGLSGMSGPEGDSMYGWICWLGALANLYFLGKWSGWIALKDFRANPIAILVAAYVLVVRSIHDWLFFLLHGNPSGLLPDLRPFDLMSYFPGILGLVCVVSLLKRKRWAWWLTLAYFLFELVTYVPLLLRQELSLYTLASALKLGWLIAIGYSLQRNQHVYRTAPTTSVSDTHKHTSE